MRAAQLASRLRGFHGFLVVLAFLVGLIAAIGGYIAGATEYGPSVNATCLTWWAIGFAAVLQLSWLATISEAVAEILAPTEPG